MKRFEEIRNEATKYGGIEYDYNDNLVETDKTIGFIIGAKWSDEHPQSPWIKCTDAIHDDYDYKIVCLYNDNFETHLGYAYSIAHIEKDKKNWIDINGQSRFVDYWMNIPPIY